MKYARIVGNVAVDMTEDPWRDFAAEVAAEFAVVDDHVGLGWELLDEIDGNGELVPEGKLWQPPHSAIEAYSVPADPPEDPPLTRYRYIVNTPPAPPAPKPVVPASVTRRQAKQALLLAGLLGNVQPAIDAIPDATQRGLVQIEWDDSQVFERDRPALNALGAALGLGGDDLDALFIMAAGLP